MDNVLNIIDNVAEYIDYLLGFIISFFTVASSYLSENPVICVLLFFVALKFIKIIKDVIL